MKLTPTLTLYEFTEVLKTALETRLGCELSGLVVTSYDKPKIVIDFERSDGYLVELVETKHVAKQKGNNHAQE